MIYRIKLSHSSKPMPTLSGQEKSLNQTPFKLLSFVSAMFLKYIQQDYKFYLNSEPG